MNAELELPKFGASQDEVLRDSLGPSADSGLLGWVLLLADWLKMDPVTDWIFFFTHPCPVGIPLYNSELESMANRGLGAALEQVNSVYAVSHLYRVTRGSVNRVSLHIRFIKLIITGSNLRDVLLVGLWQMSHVFQVIPMGLNTVDLLMTFGIKETECPKASASDPQTCAFRPGFFVVRHLSSPRRGHIEFHFMMVCLNLVPQRYNTCDEMQQTT